MGRWWSTSASDRRVAGTLLAMMLPLAVAGCGGRERAPSSESVAAVAEDDAPKGTLPTPEATPGTSVTGMPTSPPAVRGDVAAATPEPVEPPPAESAPAADALPPALDTAPTDTAGTAPASPAPPPPSPADAAAAGNLVTQYMASLGAGAFARGQMLWSTTPNDSAVLQLARNAPFDIGVGAPATDAGGRVLVPVDVRGKADDGTDRHVVATYTVQRGPAGTWRIMSATVRDVSP